MVAIDRSRMEAILSTLVTVRPHEVSALLHSSSCFFFILSAYFVVLPLRDEGALSLGLSTLPALFVGSLLLTLIAAPISTLVFSLPNLSRGRALLLIHRFFSLSLIAFFVLWHSSSPGLMPANVKHSVSTLQDIDDQAGTAKSSSDWDSHSWFYIAVRIGFFLWIALLNLITISSTWARVIDVMDNEVQDFLVLSVLVLHLVSYLAPYLPQEWLGWDHKVTIISMTTSSAIGRRKLFAQINSFIAVFIFTGQMTLTGRILAGAGVTIAICSAPTSALLNLVAIAVWPTWISVAITETMRKVVTYVVARPGRELLFTVVSQDEKYKAKVCIDVIVQRLGDATAAGMFKLLFGILHAKPSTVSLYALPVCVIWFATAVHLGRQHGQRVKQDAQSPQSHSDPQSDVQRSCNENTFDDQR